MSILSGEDATEVLRRLHERTEQGQLQWDIWREAVEYQASTENFHYYLKSRDEDDSPPYRLELWKRRTKPTGESDNVKVAEISTTDGAAYNSQLSRLYAAVKLSSIGIRDLKNDVLKDLE
ncbi:hypothetical protein [Modestobacter roseus]|uniref:Uncharacterized protein n=1 Tax=Modestobacter roseus TaxID=1181884 RepID=A0A562IV30_9ACTN|nr:hypothetical protein [Modestobacter roseus]MQA35664.1 hypothetical protein [Modestobacter roseus]TWH74867.1 hypothetical protein JD78_03413 [Modestobacter roseus]